MLVVLVVILIAMAVPVACVLVIRMSKRYSNAKKQAVKILSGESVSEKTLKYTLDVLSTHSNSMKDEEGKRLYSKLSDYADNIQKVKVASLK